MPARPGRLAVVTGLPTHPIHHHTGHLHTHLPPRVRSAKNVHTHTPSHSGANTPKHYLHTAHPVPSTIWVCVLCIIVWCYNNTEEPRKRADFSKICVRFNVQVCGFTFIQCAYMLLGKRTVLTRSCFQRGAALGAVPKCTTAKATTAAASTAAPERAATSTAATEGESATAAIEVSLDSARRRAHPETQRLWGCCCRTAARTARTARTARAARAARIRPLDGTVWVGDFQACVRYVVGPLFFAALTDVDVTVDALVAESHNVRGTAFTDAERGECGCDKYIVL